MVHLDEPYNEVGTVTEAVQKKEDGKDVVSVLGMKESYQNSIGN